MIGIKTFQTGCTRQYAMGEHIHRVHSYVTKTALVFGSAKPQLATHIVRGKRNQCATVQMLTLYCLHTVLEINACVVYVYIQWLFCCACSAPSHKRSNTLRCELLTADLASVGAGSVVSGILPDCGIHVVICLKQTRSHRVPTAT